jgi:hypothetical protein
LQFSRQQLGSKSTNNELMAAYLKWFRITAMSRGEYICAGSSRHPHGDSDEV